MTTIPVSAELGAILERTIDRLEHGHEHDKALRELRDLLASPQDSAGAVATILRPDPDADIHDEGPYMGREDWLRLQALPPDTKLYTTPQPAGPAVEVAGEREAFEAWWKRQLDTAKRHRPGDEWNDVNEDDKEQYKDAFQAGAAWQRTQSAPELGPNGSADRYFYERGYEAGKRAALAQQPNPDAARLREALDEVRRRCPLPDWARERIDTALGKVSGGADHG